MELQELVKDTLTRAYSYQEYRLLVSDLLQKDTSTGHVQSEALTNYSMLNDRRMKRLDKTIKLDTVEAQKIINLKIEVTWIVISEGWCGDAAHALPVINKLSELNDGIDLKIVLRDDNDDFMNRFLTNGSKSIPKLIAVDNISNEVLFDWGPRPSEATKMEEDYKAIHGALDPEFKKELQIWYNKNKGVNIVEDLVKLLKQ